MRRPSAALVASALLAASAAAWGQRPDALVVSRDHPAIRYSTAPVRNAISELNRRIEEGAVKLTYDAATGYLRSTLEALDIPVESQVLVFSQTSFQAPRIEPRNPRALFFDDRTAVGWVRGGPLLEVAAQDAKQGAVFYALEQTRSEKPQFQRDDSCLTCHLAWETFGVPGMMVLSTFPMPDDPNAYAGGFVSDHRRPFGERWGGWYVTGESPIRHLGNAPVVVSSSRDATATRRGSNLDTVAREFDTTGYLSPHSDIVALMLLEHQTRMMNLITRLGWAARLAEFESLPMKGPGPDEPAGGAADRVRDAVSDLVDYLLFVEEEPLPGPVRGSSGFVEKFSAQGPADSKGRSLRQFDLKRRLMRYPCSYIIYTDAFDTLLPAAKDAVYRRMWRILSGQEPGKPYDRLSSDDRRAIVEILRDTKKGLPDYFR